MAFKLTKEELATLADLTGKASEKEQAFAKALKDADEAISNAVANLNDAREELNAVIEAANEFRENVVARLREEYDAKSEKWQEGEKAEEINSFIEQWDSGAHDELNEIPTPELELEEVTLHEVLEGLPEEP